MATKPRTPTARTAGRTQQTRLNSRAARKIALDRQARQRRLLLAGGAIGAALLLALVLVLVNLPDGGDDTVILPALIPAAETYADVPQDGRSLGDPNAPVTVIEYADYQCPGCGRFAREVEPRLVEEYVKTGQVRFEYRDFTVVDRGPDDKESHRSAEAAFCAADQGQFWSYNTTLFANQYGENQGAFGEERLQAIARNIGLDMERFNGCLAGGDHADEVAAMDAEARALSLPGTPSFVVNGKPIDYSGYDSLKAAIDAELAALEGAS